MGLIKPIGPIRLIGLIGLISLIGCTEDQEQKQQAPLRTVTIMPYYSSFFEANPMPTRALPDGYQPYGELYPSSSPSLSSIGIIMTPEEFSVSTSSIRFVNNRWEGALHIETGHTYYVYGFMPSDFANNASVTDLDGYTTGGHFENGAILSINNLKTLTPADVCVIVGVKKTEEGADIRDVGIQLGQFVYEGSSSNYVYLLLKHLYAGLHFKAHIGTEYAKLRKIKVKEMKLRSLVDIHEEINLKVTLVANNNNVDPTLDPADPTKYNISYTNVGSSTSKPEITLFPYTGSEQEYELPVETPRDFLGCFAPGKCNDFELYTKYDVYDSKGNLIRQDCEARNRINASGFYGIENLKPGDIYTIDLKVEPTYLYVLSEPDLDNPTFVLQ